MACFECECKRPPDEFTDNQMQERQRGPRPRLDNVPSRKEVSDAWNFDFDENESDGAEVAAFEYADSRKLDEDFPSTRQRDEERYEENTFHFQNRRPVRPQETEYSASGPTRPGVGFDDFDDEEEDDVNSYELDTNPNHNRTPNSSSVNFSDLEVDSESEDAEPANKNWNDRRPVSSFSPRRNIRASKPLRRKSSYSEDDGGDFDSDDDLPVHPNWKSSHVADYKQKSRGRMGTKFGSDEDSDLSSGSEDLSFPPKHKGRRNSSSNDYRKAKDEFEFLDEGRDRSRGKKAIPDRRKSESPAKGFNRNDSYEGGSNRRSNKGQGSGAYERHRNEGGSHDFKSHRRENFGDTQNRRSNNARGSSSGADSYLDDERFRRPRVNVR